MKTIVIQALACLVVVATAHAACSPEQLVRLVVANESEGMGHGDFASRPKTIYRLESKFARIEEEVDEQHNIHGLVVVSEPDSWVVNLATRQGTHFVDQKAPFVVHLPIFAGHAEDKSFPRELLALEFGCESAFFDAWKSPEEPLSGSGRLKRAFGVGGWMAVVLRERNTPTPSMLFLFRKADIVETYRYLNYDVLPRDTSLFQKPPGIAFTEK